MEKKEEKERVFGKWVPAGTQPKSENSLINECIITIDSVLSDSIQLTKFTEDLYNFIKNEDVDNYAMNMLGNNEEWKDDTKKSLLTVISTIINEIQYVNASTDVFSNVDMVTEIQSFRNLVLDQLKLKGDSHKKKDWNSYGGGFLTISEKQKGRMKAALNYIGIALMTPLYIVGFGLYFSYGSAVIAIGTGVTASLILMNVGIVTPIDIVCALIGGRKVMDGMRINVFDNNYALLKFGLKETKSWLVGSQGGARYKKWISSISKWINTQQIIIVVNKNKEEKRTLYRNVSTGELRIRKMITNKQGIKQVKYVKISNKMKAINK